MKRNYVWPPGASPLEGRDWAQVAAVVAAVLILMTTLILLAAEILRQ